MIFQKLIEDLKSKAMPFTIHFTTADADMFAIVDDLEYLFSVDEDGQGFCLQDAGMQSVHLNVKAGNYTVDKDESHSEEKEYILTHRRHCEKPDRIVITFLKTEKRCTNGRCKEIESRRQVNICLE